MFDLKTFQSLTQTQKNLNQGWLVICIFFTKVLGRNIYNEYKEHSILWFQARIRVTIFKTISSAHSATQQS